jgi:hypothetical protein
MIFLMLLTPCLSLYTLSYNYYPILNLKDGDRVIYLTDSNYYQLATFRKHLPNKRCEIILKESILNVPLQKITKI